MKQEIVIKELAPGLNGSDGLKNMHWTKYRKVRDAWKWLVKAESPRKHEGRVTITYTRKSTRMMDYDNIGASFKVIGDALEHLGVIKDDSPNILTNLSLNWEKAKTLKDQCSIIEIEDVS